MTFKSPENTFIEPVPETGVTCGSNGEPAASVADTLPCLLNEQEEQGLHIKTAFVLLVLATFLYARACV